MQEMLIACGYSCGTSGADGDFGNDTYKALVRFQKANGLIVDGEYGSQSRETLTKLYKSGALEQAAKDVIAGKYGNGDARKKAIMALGLDYAAVQKRVNEILKGTASSAVYYTIQKGDTLSAIAKKYGTTASAIQKLNKSLISDVNIIQIGWKIRVK